MASARPTSIAAHVSSSAPAEFYKHAFAALRADVFDPLELLSTEPVEAPALREFGVVRTVADVDAALARFDYIITPYAIKVHRARSHAWRIVWSWCAAPTTESCQLLPRTVADVTVLVRSAGGPSALQVRTTLSPEWVDYQASGEESVHPSAWRLHDMCVCFRLARFGQQRMLLAKADARTGLLLWPRRWPAHYEQTGWEPAWYSRSNAEERDGRYTDNRTFPRLWPQAGRALVLTLTHDGLWHALFHGVAFAEYTPPPPASDVRRTSSPSHPLTSPLVPMASTPTTTPTTSSPPPSELSNELFSELLPRASPSSSPSYSSPSYSSPSYSSPSFSELLFSELLPRYTTLWPGQDACETCTRTRRRYRCARCTGRAPPVRSWYSLELVLLARMHASLWPAVHARTQELVRPDRFHCYRELHGGPGAFYPRILPQKIWPLRNYSELLLAAPRVRDFRLRVWARAGLAGGLTVHGTGLASAAVAAAAVVRAGGGHGRNKPEPPSILFVLRRESRVIVNEAALQAAVTAEAALGDVIQFVRMEDVGPLVAQIKLVARAAAIAGMHGQGLALLPLLPAHERPCALLELRSKRMGRQATHAGFDLMRWAMMSGVRYFVLKHQPDTAPCSEEDFRLCGNVTANVPEVVEALLKVWRHVHSDA